MNDTELFRIARKRAEAKLGFYVHAAVFVPVNLLLAGINLVTSPQELWFIFPLLGWGLGLAIQGIAVFGLIGSNLRERLVEAELQRLHRP